MVVSTSETNGIRLRLFVLLVSNQSNEERFFIHVFVLPAMFGLLLSSGEQVLRRQEFIVGEIIGNGGVQVNFDSSVLGSFCNEPLLRFAEEEEGGDERLLIRDVCNVSHGRS